MSEYINASEHRHDDPESIGILLVNLGTPDAPTPSALRRYLKEFLWDPRVVEMWRPLWWLILHGVILTIRPRRSARSYASVWTPEGSPLLAISKRQLTAFEAQIQAAVPGPVQVALAMRYGNPSIAQGLETLRRSGARRLLIMPLYPQYSATTVGSVFDAVADTLKRWRWVPEPRFIHQYHDDPAYIEALAASVRRQWRDKRGQLLLFSFHGLPKRYLLNGDPYYCQCQKSARLTAQALGLKEEQWRVTFQSRFGREQWLQPYTDHVLKALPAEGITDVDVVCPGFSADCLETLEEIAVENRDYFLQAGGQRYHYIEALNDSEDHIQVLTQLALRHMQGWPELTPGGDTQSETQAQEHTRERALKLGAVQ